MSISMEDRFNAAVNVIRNLPKNGSYQPSNEMMLKFYSYFKQATEGPCKQKKPAFWDVVGRAKYDAWSSLGSMPKEKAMEGYVNELRKIVETMSYTENVANFVGSISEIENVSVNDLELVAPEAMAHARSRPGSPFASRTPSPHHDAVTNGSAKSLTNGHNNATESDDEFNSADEADDTYRQYEQQVRRRDHHPVGESSSSGFKADISAPFRRHEYLDPVVEQFYTTVDAMNRDLKGLHTRFAQVEKDVAELKNNKVRSYRHLYPTWWPFKDVSPRTMVFIILWPIVLYRVMNLMQRKQR